MAAAMIAPTEVVARGAIALPSIVVESRRPPPAAKPARAAAPRRASPAAQPAITTLTVHARSGSATAPTTAQAARELRQIPGSAVVVADTEFKNAPAQTLKDALAFVAGVFAQPKWGEDTRLSIRGSGLSRNFHLRGVQLYMDGIPINTADGYGDFQEIDPTAYRHIDVYKGANALRFGANSLGGAINFVTPSGRDAAALEARIDGGGFGWRRYQSSTAGANGAFDYFITGSWEAQQGFRDHSFGELARGSANFGYQINPDVETRFYFNANTIRQRIPGSVDKATALSDPQRAAAINVANDWQRNIDSVRVANKTSVRLSDTTRTEFGLFALDRHLMHPIFQWLDYRYQDYGGFARLIDERLIGGHANRFIVGVNVLNGSIDNKQYANTPGAVKGPLLSSSIDASTNLSAYAENSFYVLPNVALVAGTNFLHATRDRRDRLLADGDQSGRTHFDILSPKVGALWDVDSTWQVFANVSRSAEVPSFGEGSSFPAPIIRFTDLKAQTATTYEIGTRGRRPDLTWDLALYHADIRNELQCIYASFGNCNVVNADKTVHQGLEAAIGVAIAKGLFINGDQADRLWLNVAYTFNDFRFDGDPTFGNNQLPGAPRHFVRAELLYKHPSGFYFGPNIEWVPVVYFVDSANTLTTEPYALIGAKIGYDDGRRYSIYIEGRNLANKAYIASTSIIDRATPGIPLFEPGSGRAVYAGLRARW
ncbi:MAG: TonB-dependent receptor family protein [Variibacter sp.]